jgi:hypothetical protein
MRIVPNSLSEQIYKRIDAAIAAADNPLNAVMDRDLFYLTLLNYFDDHSYLPDFELVKKEVSA